MDFLKRIFYICLALAFIVTIQFSFCDAKRLDRDTERLHDSISKNDPDSTVYKRDGFYRESR